jgi:hypothetical protein
MPESGVDPKVAYTLLHDELLLGESSTLYVLFACQR